ncbi:MAG: type I-U CRISPR-associated protein Csb2 [Blastocatellia bacterium]
MQLQIKLTFATRRYHGRKSEDELEFPPAPARLFQALIAGSHCGAYGIVQTAARDRALHWLEALEPPAIIAPAACLTGNGITNYVPNNDNGSKDNPLEHVRTAKGFVANVFALEHALIYRWQFAATPEAEENAATICAVTQLITHLGQHQDVVFASGAVSDDDALPEDALLPAEQLDGEWASPKPGALAAYRERYQAWLRGENKDNVTVPLRRTHYRPLNTISVDAPLALFEMWRDEDERLRFDLRDLRQPAGMVRHAMIEWSLAHPKFVQHYGQALAERLIAGHEADRQHDGAHIACIPLPSLHAEGKADGWLRRVLLIGYGCDDRAAQELFASVTDGINGAALIDQGKSIGFLKKAALTDGVLHQFIGKGQRVWRTVTPIILTGLMRRGRGAEVLLARALKQAGVPEDAIESVAAFSGPIVPKTFHALDYEIDRDSYLAQTPRYHAEVIFKRPVEGALVIGRGRHCGFGLLMPCLNDAPDYPTLKT